MMQIPKPGAVWPAMVIYGSVTLVGVFKSINEPLLVIEPSTHTGILARLSGTDVNFALNMLLMHHFPGLDGQPLSRLSVKAASVLSSGAQQSGELVAGVWNLYTWPAQRTFSAMKPELRIENVLSPGEVREWLQKMVQPLAGPPPVQA